MEEKTTFATGLKHWLGNNIDHIAIIGFPVLMIVGTMWLITHPPLLGGFVDRGARVESVAVWSAADSEPVEVTQTSGGVEPASWIALESSLDSVGTRPSFREGWVPSDSGDPVYIVRLSAASSDGEGDKEDSLTVLDAGHVWVAGKVVKVSNGGDLYAMCSEVVSQASGAR